MENINILTIIAMMITVSASLSDPRRYPDRIPGYKDDRYDPFNVLTAVCRDGRHCSSDIDVKDIDKAKLLNVVSDLLQDEGYQPLTTLFVFKGKKKKQVKWKPWLLFSQANSHIEYRRK